MSKRKKHFANSSPEKAEKSEEQIQLEQEQRISDLKELMSLKSGRRFIWDLLERTRIFHISYTGNSETFFNEGKRQVGLPLFGELHEHCLKEYLLMANENQGD